MSEQCFSKIQRGRGFGGMGRCATREVSRPPAFAAELTDDLSKERVHLFFEHVILGEDQTSCFLESQQRDGLA